MDVARNCFGPFPEKGLDLVAKIACSMVPSLLVPAGNETGLKVRL